MFIDEGANFVASVDFAKAIKDTDNYYVIVTRQDLHNIPYSINSIYELKAEKLDASGIYNKQSQLYKSSNILYG